MSAQGDTQGSGKSPLQEFGDGAMELGKEAWEKIKDVGENVGDKFTGMVSSAKLNNARSAKQKELDAAYRKLGEMAYRQGGLTGQMAEVADQIHTLYGQLQDIEIELNQTSSKGK